MASQTQAASSKIWGQLGNLAVLLMMLCPAVGSFINVFYAALAYVLFLGLAIVFAIASRDQPGHRLPH